MSTTTTSRLPPSYLANACLALSAFIVANNTFILARPRNGLDMLGFSTPVAPTDQRLALGLVRMNAATRISMGLSTIAVWYYGNYRALGWGMLAGPVMALVDGWVSRDVSGKGEWGHWGAIPISLGLGTGLLALVGA